MTPKSKKATVQLVNITLVSATSLHSRSRSAFRVPAAGQYAERCNYLKNLARRRLLLQSLGQVTVRSCSSLNMPHVLDSDHSLVGESYDEERSVYLRKDLILPFALMLIRPMGFSFSEHWHAEKRPDSNRLLRSQEIPF